MHLKLSALFFFAIVTSSAMANGDPSAQIQPDTDNKSPFDGFKVGLQGGIVFTEGKMSVEAADLTNGITIPVSADKSGKGVIGGAHAGYDKVFENNFLIGVEVFGEYAAAKGKVLDPNTLTLAVSGKADLGWSIGIMARVGYVIERTFLYLGVGWVGTDWKLKGVADSSTVPNGGVHNFTKTKVISAARFTAGIGTEIIERVILGLEGSYSTYQSQILDPAKNIRYAAHYLLELKGRNAATWSVAVGNYHSTTRSHHVRYKDLVYEHFKGVRQQTQPISHMLTTNSIGSIKPYELFGYYVKKSVAIR